MSARIALPDDARHRAGLLAGPSHARPPPGPLHALDHKPSVLQDLELRRPTEFDTPFGPTRTLARQAGVTTPTLDLMVALARQAVDTVAA